MEFTKEQLAHIREDYAKRRRRQSVIAGLSAASGLTALFLGRSNVPLPWLLAAVLALAALALLALQNWRCPACRRYLGRGPNPSMCPGCGVALR